MKFYQKKSRLLVFVLGIFTLILATGCNKKEASKSAPSLPSAASLVSTNFNKSIQSGHYQLSLSSSEMNQSSTASGYFKQNGPTYMDYAIKNKSQKQTEKIWLTDSTLYLLLQGNHGNWIKNKSDSDNFDPDQITNRFSKETFDKVNKEFVKHAQVKKEGSSSYSVSYSGTSSDMWQAINGLVVDAMNTPGSQNLNVARTIANAEVNNINIKYIVNKADKTISNISYQADFTINGKYNFTWKQTYDELNSHSDLKVPAKIQKNAIDVQKIRKQQQASK